MKVNIEDWWRMDVVYRIVGLAREDETMRMNQLRLCVVAGLCVSVAGVACADVVNPWGLSAYTTGNIGTTSSGFSGQLYSGAMTAGSAYLQSISIGSVSNFGPASGTSVFAQYQVTLNGSASGSIDAGSDVFINGASVGGKVTAGGSLKTNGSGGSISGNVSLGGTKQTGYSVSVGGSVLENQSYAASSGIAEYGAYFQAVSLQAAAAASNASASMSGTNLSITANNTGTNFVSISGSQLSAARNIAISANQNATVVVNVTGNSAAFSNIGWSLTNGASAARTIFVFDSAYDVTIAGAVQGSVLARSALVTMNSGTVAGTVVGMGLVGQGSAGASQFTGMVPAPGPVALVACGSLVVIRRRRSVG